jgi:hypothetical protein
MLTKETQKEPVKLQCPDILYRTAHLQVQSDSSCERTRYSELPDVKHGSRWRERKENLPSELISGERRKQLYKITI